MANKFTPVDACALVNLLYRESMGANATITNVDTSNFTSVGEQLVTTLGAENVYNALSMIVARTMADVRPYNAKFSLIDTDGDTYSNITRKISFYAQYAKESGDFNTDIHVNLAEGYGDGVSGEGVNSSVGSQWEQSPSYPLEITFGGRKTYQVPFTRYAEAINQAFRSAEDMASFINGMVTEKANDIEQIKEGKSRNTLLNMMGQVYNLAEHMNGACIDMTKAYNDYFGTEFSRNDLLTSHATSFYEFFVATVKLLSDYMTDRTVNYHWDVPMTKNGTQYSILRSVPKSEQRLMLLNDFMVKSKTVVFPELFNENYLSMEQYEGVNYWQNVNNKSAIDVTPSIVDVANPKAQKKGERVQLDFVLGCLFDRESIAVHNEFETVRSTPVHARKGFVNSFWSFAFNSTNDVTHPFILMYMSEDGQ